MSRPPISPPQRCILLQLWGLDIPIVAICWSVACAALMQITMITSGPVLLVAAGVWCAVIARRLKAAWNAADAWQASFYRQHAGLLLLLLLCVSMAALWILFFHVGKSILDFLPIPLFFYFGGQLCTPGMLRPIRLLLRSVAFSMFCALPAFYFSFHLHPLHLLTTSPVWYLGILFFLMARERERIRRQSSQTPDALITMLVLITLLTVSLLSGPTVPFFERTLCITIAIGAGCLQGFSRISAWLSPQQALALSWLCIALPALLGIILYAPHSW